MEKLIIVLDHPEKGTPIQAAWLLEELKDARAVPPLIDLIKETKDVYIAREAVKALGKIGTQTACQFLSTLTQQQAKMVRDEVKCILSGRHNRPYPEERKEQL